MSALLRRIAGCFAFGMLTVSAFAQEATEKAPEVASDGQTTLAVIIQKGGTPMQVIIGLSVVAFFLILYYFLSIRGGALYPKAFLRQAEDVAATGDAEALRTLCSENDSPAAKIIGAAAEHVVGDAAANYAAVRDAVEDEGARQAGFLWQRIQYLMDVAVIAPMVGLLGTVLGMMKAFAGLKAGVNIANKADALARGVGQAMYTTAGGLIVGIGAMVVYALFRGWVNRHVGRLELACSRVIRRFVSHG
jgi:biopolymer transport protein ExbB